MGTLRDVLEERAQVAEIIAARNAAASLGARLDKSKVVQQVSTQRATSGSTISLIPAFPANQTQGAQFMQVSIIPTNVNNRLLIEVYALGEENVANNAVGVLFKDADVTPLSQVFIFASAPNESRYLGMDHELSPAGTLSTITFKYRAGPQVGGTFNFRGDLSPGSIRVWELKP